MNKYVYELQNKFKYKIIFLNTSNQERRNYIEGSFRDINMFLKDKNISLADKFQQNKICIQYNITLNVINKFS